MPEQKMFGIFVALGNFYSVIDCHSELPPCHSELVEESPTNVGTSIRQRPFVPQDDKCGLSRPTGRAMTNTIEFMFRTRERGQKLSDSVYKSANLSTLFECLFCKFTNENS
jgi:hypothetical protein